MRRWSLPILVMSLLAAACGPEPGQPSLENISREPVSVRGWIHDVRGSVRGETIEIELARRTQLFQSTSVWVEDSPYSSGGIAESGAFVVLDVPPGLAILGFNAPGAEDARVELRDVPGNADVFLPDLVLEPGGATFLDPSKLVIRIATNVVKRTPTGRFATVNGVQVPILEVPLSEMVDRRDYPSPPGFRPVATVR